MNAIKVKLSKYFDTIEKKEILKTYNDYVDKEVTEFNYIFCKILKYMCVPNEYIEYKIEINSKTKAIRNEIKDPTTKKYLIENPSLINKYIIELYFNSIFDKNEHLICFIKEFGGEKINFNFFIDIDEYEDIMLGIVKDGVIVNFLEFLLILELYIKKRVYQTVFDDFLGGELIRKYDKREDVPSIAIELENIFRKLKYNAKQPNEKKEFERKIIEMINNSKRYNTSLNLSKAIVDLANLRDNNTTYRQKLFDILKPLVDIHGNKKIKKVFKPYFHLLFENKKSGLLTEDCFNDIYTNRIGQSDNYDGNYNKYYYDRIKLLVGI
jgi:hypothetical protein